MDEQPIDDPDSALLQVLVQAVGGVPGLKSDYRAPALGLERCSGVRRIPVLGMSRERAMRCHMHIASDHRLRLREEPRHTSVVDAACSVDGECFSLLIARTHP